MGDFLEMSVWEKIKEKTEAGERLSSEEGVYLFREADLHQLGQLADGVRERKVGKRASYVLNRYLNYSNICVLSCQFCAFARRKREPGTFELSVSEVVDGAKQAVALGATEIHIVGGLHPSLPYEFYLEMLRGLAGLEPRPMLKVFTAIEIRHLAERVAKKPMVEVLGDLQEAGLDSLTGVGQRYLMRGCERGFVGGKSRPRSGWRCTEFGMGWVGEARRRCCMVMWRRRSRG